MLYHTWDIPLISDELEESMLCCTSDIDKFLKTYNAAVRMHMVRTRYCKKKVPEGSVDKDIHFKFLVVN